MSAMDLIRHIEVGSGGAASIEFTSIPQTYTDLYLVTSIRTGRSVGVDGLLVKANNSTANFTYRRLYGTGSSAASDSGIVPEMALVSDTGNTANTLGSLGIYIPNYTSSTAKSFSGDSVTENNATAAYQAIYAGLWNDTTAISSLVLASATSFDFEQYSSATLYGITAGSDGTTTVS